MIRLKCDAPEQSRWGWQAKDRDVEGFEIYNVEAPFDFSPDTVRLLIERHCTQKMRSIMQHR